MMNPELLSARLPLKTSGSDEKKGNLHLEIRESIP